MVRHVERENLVPTKAKAQPKKFEAGSWSRFNDHRRCGLYAKLKYLDKLPEPGSPAMERGGAIHKLGERYVLGQIRILPEELKLFKEEFAYLRKVGANVEGQLAVDRGWNPCDWFSRDAWLRVVTDARHQENKGKTIVGIDYKTGKVYEENDEQLSLYSPVLFAHHPEADELILKLWYLDAGEEKVYRYRREGIKAATKKPGGDAVDKRPSFDELKAAWAEKLHPLLTDRKFVATPNEKCRYCHFRKSNGGPCRY